MSLPDQLNQHTQPQRNQEWNRVGLEFFLKESLANIQGSVGSLVWWLHVAYHLFRATADNLAFLHSQLPTDWSTLLPRRTQLWSKVGEYSVQVYQSIQSNCSRVAQLFGSWIIPAMCLQIFPSDFPYSNLGTGERFTATGHDAHSSLLCSLNLPMRSQMNSVAGPSNANAKQCSTKVHCGRPWLYQ